MKCPFEQVCDVSAFGFFLVVQLGDDFCFRLCVPRPETVVEERPLRIFSGKRFHSLDNCFTFKVAARNSVLCSGGCTRCKLVPHAATTGLPGCRPGAAQRCVSLPAHPLESAQDAALPERLGR
jgi:hypothetical protein